MKKVYNYCSFCCAIIFGVVFIWILLVTKETNAFLWGLGIISLISWVIFGMIRFREAQLKKHIVYVWGKIIPESVRAIPILRGFIVKCKVSYFNPKTSQTVIFSGSCMAVYLEYLALKKEEDIWVKIGYDSRNFKNHIIFLEDALKELKLF
ncbi:MAG: hypothetical protein J6K43_09700 [Lachnospiraceae bacterium]|nr:hypothetical protein [Lachnospiraceae bacterium]